jgi:para-aminobenzoate synthetase/4-amino-4-deoxychorismate lyase
MNRWHPLPQAVYTLVEETPGTILLESSRPRPSTVSRLFLHPQQIIEARSPSDIDSLFAAVEDTIHQDRFAAGYFAYECGACFEPAAARHVLPGTDLLAWIGIYDRCYTFDHRTDSFLDHIPAGLSAPGDLKPLPSPAVSLALDELEYSARIAQVHDWIRAGDVYQLNFTFPLRADIAEPPASLYARLRNAQPVEYSAFLHCQDKRHILSLSPELFFHTHQDVSSRHITTRPMKGTARRGRTNTEDREISAWLSSDPKNRAENVMIVDLIRNDLGRICNYGSVQVESLFEVERFPTLWQMTSTITGELRPNFSHNDIFRALFPCGSVTGAPKIRAMQLLGQIEDQPRGIYTGAIGFFSREQSVFNVAIRTITLEYGSATMGVGSGIVIDSDPQTEFRECQLKAEFLTRLAEPFSLIETMLSQNGSYPLLDLHLDRLCDSADYFSFPCDRHAIQSALLTVAASFALDRPSRVRLLLDADGVHHIDSEPIADPTAEITLRVCIANERTDPANRFLFHKTTLREPYNRAFAEASAAGFADVLFLNLHGQVTEGAISNVFIEKAGRWYTPPIECGVLPGIYRRHLLETRTDIEERILTLDALKSADAIYICNAVRGLRKVQLISAPTNPS